jgi:hypothetical protein
MRVIIDVKAHYDWLPLPPDAAAPSDADVKALRVKPSHSGGWLMKVRKERDTHTEIVIPEAQIQDLMEHYERIGSPKRRGAVVAWLLEEKVMPHHAHGDDFVKCTVEGEPDVETFLNQYFELGDK